MKQIAFANALLTHGSVLLYGDDIRPSLPNMPFSRYVLDVIESGVYHLGIPRQRKDLSYPLPEPLIVPLDYPNVDEAFYGYDRVPARPATPPATRILVGIGTWIATFLLALETGHYACQKSECIRLCKQYLPDDTRIQLAAHIYDLCKLAWKYRIPDLPEDQVQLQQLCQDVLALENEYLQLVHAYMLERLRHGEAEEQRQVTRILQNVVYQDNDKMMMKVS